MHFVWQPLKRRLTPCPPFVKVFNTNDAGWSSWQLVGLITRRSQVRVLSLLKLDHVRNYVVFFLPKIGGASLKQPDAAYFDKSFSDNNLPLRKLKSRQAKNLNCSTEL